MTARAQDGMNVVLALAVPAAGLAYLTSAISTSPVHFSVAITVVFGMLWFTAMAARNAIVGPQPEVATHGSVDERPRNADDDV